MASNKLKSQKASTVSKTIMFQLIYLVVSGSLILTQMVILSLKDQSIIKAFTEWSRFGTGAVVAAPIAQIVIMAYHYSKKYGFFNLLTTNKAYIACIGYFFICQGFRKLLLVEKPMGNELLNHSVMASMAAFLMVTMTKMFSPADAEYSLYDDGFFAILIMIVMAVLYYVAKKEIGSSRENIYRVSGILAIVYGILTRNNHILTRITKQDNHLKNMIPFIFDGLALFTLSQYANKDKAKTESTSSHIPKPKASSKIPETQTIQS